MSHDFVVKQINVWYACEACAKEMSGSALNITSVVPFVLKNHVLIRDCQCRGRFIPTKIRMDLLPRECMFLTPVNDNASAKVTTGSEDRRDTKTNYYRFVVRCGACGSQYARYKMLDRPMTELLDAEFDRLLETFVCDNTICKLRQKDSKMSLVSCTREFPSYD